MTKTYSELKEQILEESKVEQLKPEVEEWLTKNKIPFSRVSVNPNNNKLFVEYKETITAKEENKANEYLSSLGDPYQLGVRKMSVTVSESADINEEKNKLASIAEEAVIATLGKFGNYIKGVSFKEQKTGWKVDIRFQSDITKNFKQRDIEVAVENKVPATMTSLIKDEVGVNSKWERVGTKEQKTSFVITVKGSQTGYGRLARK